MAPLSTTTFDEAIERFDASLAVDSPDIDPRCRSMLLHHGDRTERTLVLFHGFTNCPLQWSVTAAEAHRRGMTVLAPRAPGHGRADKRPDDLTHLSADSLAEWIAGSVDIARGFSDRVTVAGFSFGGVCAGWAARNLDSVDVAMLLAPAYLPYGCPTAAARLLPAAARVLPERYMWWNPVTRERGATSPHTYPQLSRKGIAAVFELGLEAGETPASRKSPLRKAVLVLNESDIAVNPRAARQAFEAGIAPLAQQADVRIYPLEQRYPHDLIDPAGLNAQRADKVAVELLGLLDI